MKTKTGDWCYHLTWQLEDESRLQSMDVREDVKKMILEWCEALEGNFIDYRISLDRVQFAYSTPAQLNVHKVIKGLQKKLEQRLQTLKLVSIVTQVIDDQHEESHKDIRVRKILESLWAVEYYDLDECVTEDLEAFRNYLCKRKLATMDVDGQLYLIDTKALSQEINLNCFECTKLYKYGCCCGSPCDMSRKNQKLFEQHLSQLAEELRSLNEKNYNEVMEKGGFISFDGSIKACNGRCSLLVEHEGVYKCMAHKYALDHHLSIYEFCPLSCLMYPLEIIELITDKKKKVILLTSVVEEDFATTYGRWGSYKSLDIDHRCVNKKDHNEVFRKEHYKLVYRVNKNLISYEFGPEVYEGLEQLFLS